MTLRWNSRGIYVQAKGDYLDRVHSDQTVLKIVRWRLSHMSKSNSRGTIRLESTQIRWWPGRRLHHCEVVAMDTQVRSGQMVLMVVRQGGWTTSMVAKDVRGRVGK
jgi:hypothetical protein